MGFYNDLRGMNIYSKLKPLIAKGVFEWVWADGKRKLHYKVSQEFYTPWHHIEPAPGNEVPNQCYVWKDILYNYISRTLPKEHQFVPSGCHDCWKVVIVPRTLYELMALDGMMRQLKYTSKCGIELRQSTNRNYGGYLYTRSKEEAQSRYEEVKGLMAGGVLDGAPIFIKRGCTEYEVDGVQGGTRNWHVTALQRHIEGGFYDLVSFDEEDPPQADQMVVDVVQTWIEHAWSIADPTVELIAGERLYPKYETYEEESGNGESADRSGDGGGSDQQEHQPDRGTVQVAWDIL